MGFIYIRTCLCQTLSGGLASTGIIIGFLSLILYLYYHSFLCSTKTLPPRNQSLSSGSTDWVFVSAGLPGSRGTQFRPGVGLLSAPSHFCARFLVCFSQIFLGARMELPADSTWLGCARQFLFDVTTNSADSCSSMAAST